MGRSRPSTQASFLVMARSAMIVAALSTLALSGCQVREAPKKLRVERNFVVNKTPGKMLPSISLWNLRVRDGKLAVSIDGERHELETLTVTPPGPGPFPLAVMSHGNSRNQRRVKLARYRGIAEDFAERGYKAVIFARRGAASSTGDYVDNMQGCRHLDAGRTSAEDYTAVIEELARRPDIDGSIVIAAGQSGGGFAVLALASRPPAGLVGVVNFAGGRGGNRYDDFYNCNEFGLIDAFTEFGKTARIPALWLYSTTDHFFWPDLVKSGFDAYAGGGAPVRLEWFGPLLYAEDGHRLYRGEGQYLWSPRIGAFLKDIGAPSKKIGPGG